MTMLVQWMSRSAASLAKKLPAPTRSLYVASRIVNRPSHVAVIQRLAFESNTHRTFGFNAPFAARHNSSSRSDEGAHKTETMSLQDSTFIGHHVYQAPMSRAVRLMKAVSVTSCTLTSIGMPVLCMVSEQDTSAIGKWAMCGTIMLFGLGTTSLFHYLFKPYVMNMWLANLPANGIKAEAMDDSIVTVESVTLFAQLTRNSFRLSEVSPPAKAMHPMVSFQARGHHYFIHPEAFEDQNLLKKLVGAAKKLK